MTTITVIDYGAGNLLSIQRALEHWGAEVRFARTPEDVLRADRLVLPGVGAFRHAMNELNALELVEPLREWSGLGRPLLGICLGMQLLLESSEEFGRTEGLGMVPGGVAPVPPTGLDGTPHRIPHIGWNALFPVEGGASWAGTFLADVEAGEATYFVHSFMAVPSDRSHLLAVAFYDGREIPAVIRRDNIFGCQFHPEKSAEVGLSILRRFVAAG